MSQQHAPKLSRDFYLQMRTDQIEWRRTSLSNQLPGKQNGKNHPHVLPLADWELNLWPGINSQSGHSLPQYLEANSIRKHTGSHNLLSSWILCANLYFPFWTESGRQMLLGFLRQSISPEIKSITGLELEYELDDPALKPPALLGEMDGGRGAGQTSPDIAFMVETERGPGIILVECKFTEHHFYPCSGRKTNPRNGQPNHDRSRCLNAAAVLANPAHQCHLQEVPAGFGRKYWNHLGPIINRQAFAQLKSCPAAFDGYQLFRQQSLAEGIAQSGEFDLVYSVVVYDERNSGLMLSLQRSTGIANLRTDRSVLFAGRAKFATCTHQAWVKWVQEHDDGHWKDWREYVTQRYGL